MQVGVLGGVMCRDLLLAQKFGWSLQTKSQTMRLCLYVNAGDHEPSGTPSVVLIHDKHLIPPDLNKGQNYTKALRNSIMNPVCPTGGLYFHCIIFYTVQLTLIHFLSLSSVTRVNIKKNSTFLSTC